MFQSRFKRHAFTLIELLVVIVITRPTLKLRRASRHLKPAFTLIELLVVIVIIGILATLATIALNSTRARARDAKRVADIKQMQTALELYFSEIGRYPTGVDNGNGSFVIGKAFVSDDGINTYMRTVPKNPQPYNDGNCNPGSEYIYTQLLNGTSYTIGYCLGLATGEAAAGMAQAMPGTLNFACTPSCSGKCGGAPDGCGGTCVALVGCSGGQVCNAQVCCTQNCSGRECGTDSCGGSCAPNSCAADKSCNSSGVCVGFGEVWQSVEVDGPSSWKKPYMTPDGNYMIVSRNSGNDFYYSEDGGISWAKKLIPSSNNINQYAITDDGSNILIFTGTYYYRSSDKGVNWTSQSWSDCTGCVYGYELMSFGSSSNDILIRNTDNYFYRGYVNSTGWSKWSSLGNNIPHGITLNKDNAQKIMYASFADTFLSTNGGSSFSNINNCSNATGYFAMSFDGTKILCSLTDGSVYYSLNGGSSFSQLKSSVGPKVNFLFDDNYGHNRTGSSDLSKLYGYNSSDGLYSMDNLSGAWNLVNSASMIKTYGYAFSSSASGQRLIGKDGGYVYLSNDYGVTFNKANFPVTSRNWSKVIIGGTGQKMLAITDGLFLGSSDYGQTWSQVNSSSQNCSYIAGVANLQKIYCVRNSYDQIRVSDDGGATWTDRTPSPLTSATRQWYDVASSADGMRAVAVIGNGYIYTTSDGGVTWTERIVGGGNKNWYNVAISDSGQYMVATINAAPVPVWVSSDYGVTWNNTQSLSSSFANMKLAMSGDGSKVMFAGVGTDPFYKSIDYGSTFPTTITKPGSEGVVKIFLNQDGSKLSYFNNGNKVYVSVDGGTNWTLRSTGVSGTYRDVSMSRDGSTMVILADGKIYISRQ